MPTPDPKNNPQQAGTQPGAYPLDRYTVAPKQDDSSGQSPYYQPAAPGISLPKGGGALKGIDEKFSVNAVNGTAGLQVGLPLSPGRAGFTPALSLSYSSGSGNSEFGLGWGLSLPAIQRRTSKQLPLYDDAGSSDVFVMAGAEDLQPLLIYTDGEWQPDVFTPASTNYTVKRYRPRTEGLFAHIEHISSSTNAHTWWKVTTKDNIVTYYGLSAAGRVADPADDTRIFKWLPQLAFDNKGNVQQYFYVTDSNTNLSALPNIPNAIQEQNRRNGYSLFTNTYLNNVAYCNMTPFTPSDPWNPQLPPSFNDATAPDYAMLLVMDYGNYHAAAPTPFDDLTVPYRTDPFSDFHACFEIRTYRRCMRALMFHMFGELNSGTPTLVRSVDFTWQSDTESPMPQYTEADLIASVTQNGYLLQDGGTYFKKSLPPITMAYNPLQWNHIITNISPQDAENAPQGISGPYQWMDLWGEGIPGILTEQADSWWYKRNLGNGHFAPSVAVAEKPNFQGLGSTMQWTDLEADGRRQLVSRDSNIPGYFELDDNQDWQPFRTFKEWINVDWNSPYTKILDLNGDGRPDVLITEERAWRWYENIGTEGYADGGYGPTSYNEEKRPRLLLNDLVQTIFLADMNGDGITDIVRIQNGEVCYWPNMGYGQFGAKVTMSDAPWFDAQDIFNPEYIVLADIGGTGTTDIIYLGKETYRAWLNMTGNAWGPATDIATLPSAEPYSKITVTDLLGTGTQCLVWSSPLPQHAWAPMRYIDLMGGNKPYLMNAYSNNMGKTIELTYKQSTQYYLEDALTDDPWATLLPFPVHCVSEVTTTDDVSQTIYTQQYSYHHGYYDHPEREFRGFGRVDTIDTDMAVTVSPPGDLDQYPVLTKTWYHTGAWMREGTLLNAYAHEYFPLDWAELPTAPAMLPVSTSPPTAFTAQDEREAYRCMKGQFVRQEVYALDGSDLEPVPYTVTTQAFCIQQVQPVATNLYGSFFCYTQQSLTYSCERNVADPRVLHELTLAVDRYGNVLEAAKVSYPRLGVPSPPVPDEVALVQARMLCTYSTTDYTNDVTDNVGGGYHLRVPWQAATYELTGLLPLAPSGLWTCSALYNAFHAAQVIAYTDTPHDISMQAQARMIGNTRSLFYPDLHVTHTDTPLGYGVIESRAIPYQQYHLAFSNNILGNPAYYNGLVTTDMLTGDGGGGYLQETDIAQFPTPLVDTNYWLPLGTVSYDANNFYSPTDYYDPWGNHTQVSYWHHGSTNYYLLPLSVTDALDNTNTVNAYNWYNLQPTSTTDPNDNVSQILYDALGMPVAAALMGKNDGTEGDTLAGIDPESSTDIGNQGTFFTDPESVASDLLQGATWRCVYDLTTSPVAIGMLGREFHYYDTSYSPPPSPPGTAPLIRLTYTDGLGRIAMNKIQAAPAEGETTIRWIGSGKTIYNNKGKVVMQYEPYFSTTPLYDSEEQAAAEGVTPRMHYDPLGRVIRTDLPDGSFTMTEWDSWMQVVYDNNDTVTDSQWYYNATHGTAEQQDAAAKAAECYGTPTTMHLDTLARAFYTIQHNRIPGSTPSSPWVDLYYDSYVDLDIQGNRRAIHDARGNTPLTYSYNMLQAVVQQVSMDSGTQFLLADAMGKPLYAWDADEREFYFTYDELHRQLQKEVTYGGGTKVLEVMIYGEGQPDDTVNNLRGQIYEIYDGAGIQTIPSYDFKYNPNSTIRQYVFVGTQTPDWSGTVDMEDATYTTAMTYDALNRPLTITSPDGGVTAYVYEQTGLLFGVHVSNVGGSSGTPPYALSTDIINEIYYDAKGQRLKVKFENGATTTYSYDPDTFRVIEIKTTRSSGTYTILQDLLYWYDPVGNITTQQDAAQEDVYFNGTVASPTNDYTYDALYRLIIAQGREYANANAPDYNDSDRTGITPLPVTASAMAPYAEYYTYDEVGNMTKQQHTTVGGTGNWTRTFTIDTTSNRLTANSIGSNSPVTEDYTYDNRGNIVLGFNQLYTGAGNSMTYNADNRLEKVLLTSSMTAYYQYDSGGQRVRKTIINTGSSITEVRKYIGQWELYDKIDTGTSTIMLERETLHVMDDKARIALIDTPVIIPSGSGEVQVLRYQFSNHLGTATLELDDAAQVISYEEYYPYGGSSFQCGESAAEVSLKRYRYVGKERDEETGFYYIGARYYVSWLCRWIASDPLENKYTPESSYNYCHNNPIFWNDLSGMGAGDTNSEYPTSPTFNANITNNANGTVSGIEFFPVADYRRAVPGGQDYPSLGFKIGEYSITPTYVKNDRGKLILSYYTAFKDGRADWIIGVNDLTKFRSIETSGAWWKRDTFSEVADDKLVEMNSGSKALRQKWLQFYADQSYGNFLSFAWTNTVDQYKNPMSYLGLLSFAGFTGAITGEGSTLSAKIAAAESGDLSAAAELRVAEAYRLTGQDVQLLDADAGNASSVNAKTPDLRVGGKTNVEVKRISGIGKNTAGDLAKGVRQAGPGGTVVVVRPDNSLSTFQQYQDFINNFKPQYRVNIRLVNESSLPKFK